MPLFDSLIAAWRILGRNKIRSFLTMLGVIIGVMSVVIIMAVGAGAQSLILNQVKSLGSNLVGILPGKSEDTGPPAAVLGVVITTLKTADIEGLTNGVFPYIKAATVYVRGAGTATFSENKVDTNYVGTSGSYPLVEDVTLAQGRFFTTDEDRSSSRVAVLGSEAAEDLFGDLDPIDQRIKIKKTSFTVVGVLRERGVSGFQNQDDQIFIPVTVAQKELLGIDYVNFARVKIDDAAHVNESIEQIKVYLRERHGITNPESDDFSIRSANQGLEALTQITNALKFFLAAIAAISLIVGGIGIMNIMLAAVEERTREIGLRKAIGAKNSQITWQFLVETIMITFIGGIVGITLGVIIAIIVSQIAKGSGYDWDLVISPWSIILGCVVSISIGLIFGVIPARRASRLNPIEALRYE